MEVIIGIICVIIVIYIVIHVVLPISGVVGIGALAIGVLYALAVSVSSFFQSLSEHINPYTTYVDSNPIASSGTRRGYFFGPGYHQISITVTDAFENQREQFAKIEDWKTEFVEKHKGKWYLNVFVYIFYIAAWISVYVFSSILVSAFSVGLFSVIFAGMCVFFAFFSLLWAADRISLLIRSVHSRCPNDKRVSVVPLFCCPDCGTAHINLTPGPYGTFYRKCGCGKRLPTTVFNGRSALRAVCPFCGSELASGGASQFGIQMIGSTSSGKTTFLSAFFHIYIEKLKMQRGETYSLFPEEAFQDLEYWYNQGLSSATYDKNATMYSVVRHFENGSTQQFTLYDIAGESFRELEGGSTQQQQFKYCEALIFVIDPTDSPENAFECINGFTAEFRKMGGFRASKMAKVPMAIMITKADLFKKEIGLPIIRTRGNAIAQQNGEITPMDAQIEARNELCRGFLNTRGFSNVVNAVESEFSNIAFFAVSSMGHDATPGMPYQPWGVEAPIDWIFEQCEGKVAKIM